MSSARDHGGRIDDACAKYGGTRDQWLDLSTGINPVTYPLAQVPSSAWAELPDRAAFEAIGKAARRFWSVPSCAGVLPAPGASSLIAQMPYLTSIDGVRVAEPTYNEHRAAFDAAGIGAGDDAQVVVHPNNPDGRIWTADEVMARHRKLTVIDESFCDVAPELSLIKLSAEPGVIVLKSFGKFWGLAGMRLGFAIGDPNLMERLRVRLGPWQVSGPALSIGARALTDTAWAAQTRVRLQADCERLDAAFGLDLVGGCLLFRTYSAPANLAEHLARHRILVRRFPYAQDWIRVGLPSPERWTQLEAAL